VPDWPGHLPGQHVDVRITSEDGYQATRSYSLAAPARGDRVELTVQRLRDGEVSPYLVDVMPAGGRLQILGPVGGWFVSRPVDPDPVLLIAGGIGIVPVMAMLRARRGAGNTAPVRLLYSLRSPEWLCYGNELRGDPEAAVAYTRLAPLGHPRSATRLTPAEICARGLDPADGPLCYVCGPNGFVEAMTTVLTRLGHDPARIKTERLGASAGLTLSRT
jgi:ferredoxin-NADP reductase